MGFFPPLGALRAAKELPANHRLPTPDMDYYFFKDKKLIVTAEKVSKHEDFWLLTQLMVAVETNHVIFCR